jgi:phosphodiesterase/alkaline phosphatase D-like protein
MDCIKRRHLLQTVATSAVIPSSFSSLSFAVQNSEQSNEHRKPLRFGVISDLHFGFRPDVESRLQQFVNEMNDKNVDFIIQLGDYCFPDD